MKKILIVALIASVSAPAFADQQLIDAMIGAAVGGGGARALSKNVRSNSKRNMITAVGALGGAWAGSKIGDDSGQRHQDQMNMRQREMDQNRYQYEDSRYQNQRQVQPINVSYNQPQDSYQQQSSYQPVSQPSRRSARWDAQPSYQDQGDVDVDVIVNVPPVRAAYHNPTPRNSGGCDTSQFNDPAAARAYCAGRAEYIRQAYERGASGR